MAIETEINALTTVADAEAVAALALQRAEQLRSATASADATLRQQIGDRVAELRSATVAAQTFATTQTARAGVVRGTVPALNLAYLMLVRDELALIREDLAKVGAANAVSTVGVADLAAVVSGRL